MMGTSGTCAYAFCGRPPRRRRWLRFFVIRDFLCDHHARMEGDGDKTVSEPCPCPTHP